MDRKNNLFKSYNNNQLQTCDILGVNINVTNMKETVSYIEKNIENLKGNYICVSNVHTTVMAYEDVNYRNIQNSGAMALPDGSPLSILSRLRGFKSAERVTGPDLMEEIFKISEEKGYTHYFYGSTEETLEQLKIKLNQKYPKLKIVGIYSPPFRNLKKEEDEYIVKKINESKTNFLWVGLGAPKQEIWMYAHKNKIRTLMIGVGAGFDYHAEKIQRAPKWMQKCSLEWLYRLIQEPRRLFLRYTTTNFKFLYLNIKNSLL
ncbi:WecB/TagA/CpsF family glycosyltransferase [Clostridium perfringens]|nr:WecB/TagA/CpsF family glycosyltransferase [Clostridium perfringens]